MTLGPIPATAPALTRAVERKSTKVRTWQAGTSGSGLLLALTLFLPAMKGCGDQPDVPVAHWTKMVADRDFSVDNIRTLLVCYGLAYVFGALACGGALARWADQPRWAQRSSRCTVALILLTTGILALSVLEPRHGSFTRTYSPEGPLWLVPAAGMTSLWLWAAQRLRERAPLGYALLGSMLCGCWFAYWIITTDHPLYGIYLSLFGSLGVAVATVGEVSAITGSSLPRAAANLLTCRPTGVG